MQVSQRKISAMQLSHKDIQDRYQLSFEAMTEELDRWDLVYIWKYAFRKHLEIGEDWDESYRFPELFGVCQRRRNNLLDFLPEMKGKGQGDNIIALNSSLNQAKDQSNLKREKIASISDAVDVGSGWIFAAPVRFERIVKENGKEVKRLFYDGYASERVDARDIIPAYSAIQLHDHTGQNYCPYLFRRRLYTKATYLFKFSGEQFNQAKVKAMSLKASSYSDAFGYRPITDDEAFEKSKGEYVGVLEYWDQENDIMKIYAGEFSEEGLIFDSPNGIPYAHKQLPFHVYYNYKKEDSILGIGEVELNMPYNLLRESIMNLQIDDAKLALQPAYIIDGDVEFNTEENELAPGAIFRARGLTGKVQDSVMPFRSGGISSDSFQLLQAMESSQIAVTQDDFRALFVNPNQLATQTLAKREALLKGVRTNAQLNLYMSEYYLTKQLISYLGNELAGTYEDEKGKTMFRKIKVKGYAVKQNKEDSDVKFVQDETREEEFALNAKVAEGFKDAEIEVISIKEDDEIKRDKNQKLVTAMGQVLQFLSQNPQGQQVLGSMDIGEFMKEIFGQLDVELEKVFPSVAKSESQIDPISAEHEMILLGKVPPIRPDEDSMTELMEHRRFATSKQYKEASKDKRVKDAYNEHITLTIENVIRQKTTPPSVQAGTPEAPQLAAQGGISGLPQIPREQVQ